MKYIARQLTLYLPTLFSNLYSLTLYKICKQALPGWIMCLYLLSHHLMQPGCCLNSKAKTGLYRKEAATHI